MEKDLRDLAAAQGRDIHDLVEEAIRQFLEAGAVTDLDVVQLPRLKSNWWESFVASRSGRVIVLEVVRRSAKWLRRTLNGLRQGSSGVHKA